MHEKQFWKQGKINPILAKQISLYFFTEKRLHRFLLNLRKNRPYGSCIWLKAVNGLQVLGSNFMVKYHENLFYSD